MTHLLHLQSAYKHLKSILGPQVAFSPHFSSILSRGTTRAKQHLKPSPSFANSSHAFTSPYNPGKPEDSLGSLRKKASSILEVVPQTIFRIHWEKLTLALPTHLE
ncbi:hypothetical protein Tco_1439035 [Tanacetum coccineum]